MFNLSVLFNRREHFSSLSNLQIVEYLMNMIWNVTDSENAVINFSPTD